MLLSVQIAICLYATCTQASHIQANYIHSQPTSLLNSKTDTVQTMHMQNCYIKLNSLFLHQGGGGGTKAAQCIHKSKTLTAKPHPRKHTDKYIEACYKLANCTRERTFGKLQRIATDKAHSKFNQPPSPSSRGGSHRPCRADIWARCNTNVHIRKHILARCF